MAPKKENVTFASFADDQQFYEGFRQKLYDGFLAQKIDLDKISFIIELSVLQRGLVDIGLRLNRPDDLQREDACSKKKANKNASSKRSSLKTRYVYVCRI